MPQNDIYYTEKALEVLRENLKGSNHFWAIANNPIHAYFCNGECNAVDETQSKVSAE